MFRETNAAKFAALAKAFCAAVEVETGSKSTLDFIADPAELRRQLSDGKLQLALVHGFEFAWMKQVDPNLKPLMIAAPVHRPIKAALVVSSRDPAQNLDDLRGKTLALPSGSQGHARLFAERQCRCGNGDDPGHFFAEITTPSNSESALHALFDSKAQAAIVDAAALRCFADRYPARFHQIRTLIESPSFPLDVVVVREGALSPEVVRRFQAAMSRAHTGVTTKPILSRMQISGFEPIPPDFDE